MSEKIERLVEKAHAAQDIIADWSQEKVDMMVAAVGWELYKEENAAKCTALATEETAMGIYEDKLLKHKKKTLGTLRDLDGLKTTGVVEVDKVKGLIKIAKPVGVIAAIIPVTNPTSTLAGNGLAMLKTRNAVIFSAHPKSSKSTGMAIDFMRAGLEKVGAPVDLVQIIPNPTKEDVVDLMAASDLVVATGSSALVKVAYSSGTPAYGVGAGNAVCVVDETADLDDAANKIFLSKTFDNATSCSSENSLVIKNEIWDYLIAKLESYGGYLCLADEKSRLQDTLWPDGEHLNPKIVAQPILDIAKLAGIEVPKETKFIMVFGNDPVESDKFSAEKLCPVLTLWKYNEFIEAIEYVERLTKNCGYGHSCGIHSTNDEHILELGLKCHVSRMMVRQPQCYGNSGNYDNGMPFSMTLGCGTWGGNASSDNITWKHFLNYTWISSPITPVVPDEDKIFSDYWEKYGK